MIDPDKTYYLCGPMTGLPEYNYPAFESAAQALRGQGLRIVSPHEIPWPEGSPDMEVEDLWRHMMTRAILTMLESDGIILLTGWPQSKGARRELALGLEYEMPVYFYFAMTLVSMNGNRQ